MSVLRSVQRGVWVLFHRDAADSEICEELAHYYAEAEAECKKSGLSSFEARRVVESELGELSLAQETVQEFGWERVLTRLATDARSAAQFLRAHLQLATTIVLTLAIGIFVTTLLFAVVNPLLLRPLPNTNADRLVVLRDRSRIGGLIDATYGTFNELRSRAHSFEFLAADDPWNPVLVEPRAERLTGKRVTAGYFRTLGIELAEGRDFAIDDNVDAAQRVAVVTNRLRDRLGGSDPIIGRSLELNGRSFRVIGVIDAQLTEALSPGTDLWAPLRAPQTFSFTDREWGHHYRIVGRLASNATRESATRELSAIARNPVARFPRPSWSDMSDGLVVRPARDELVTTTQTILGMSASASAILIAIVILSIVIIVPVVVAVRDGESGVRAAFSSQFKRLSRRLLLQHILLVAAAGFVGIVLTPMGAAWFSAFSPRNIGVWQISLGRDTLIFAAGLTMICGLTLWLLFNHVPRHRAPRVLVICQVGLASVLVVMTGLMGRSLKRLSSEPPGFNASGLITMQIFTPAIAADGMTATRPALERALESVRQVPGVTQAALTNLLPLTGPGPEWGYEVASRPRIRPGDAGSVLRYAVSADYFNTMGIPLLKGRLFRVSDTVGAAGVAVISTSQARRMFGDTDPIGQRVRLGAAAGDSTSPWSTIVGVVGDVKQRSLAEQGSEAIYVPVDQGPDADVVYSIVARTDGRSVESLQVLRQAAAVPGISAAERVVSMADIVSDSLAEQRMLLVLMGTFAFLATIVITAAFYFAKYGTALERPRRERGSPPRPVLLTVTS